MEFPADSMWDLMKRVVYVGMAIVCFFVLALGVVIGIIIS